MTIVHSGDKILPGPFADKLRTKLTLALEKKKIEVVLNTMITNLPSDDSLLSKQTLVSGDGKEFQADVVLKCIGSKITKKVEFTELSDVYDDKGFIKVNGHLQVPGADNIFAIGDASSADLRKLSFLADMQASTAAKNIKALVTKSKLQVFKGPSGPVIIVPYVSSLLKG